MKKLQLLLMFIAFLHFGARGQITFTNNYEPNSTSLIGYEFNNNAVYYTVKKVSFEEAHNPQLIFDKDLHLDFIDGEYIVPEGKKIWFIPFNPLAYPEFIPNGGFVPECVNNYECLTAGMGGVVVLKMGIVCVQAEALVLVG